MTAGELAGAALSLLLLLTALGALEARHRTALALAAALEELAVAVDALDTLADTAERHVANIADELGAVTAERDAARARAALAETRERIAHEGWGRAVDRLLVPVIRMPELDRESLEQLRRAPMHLQAVPRG